MGKRREVSNEEFESALRNTDYIKLIKWVTGSYASVLTQDDLKTAGLEGLWRALGYHQEGKGKKFTTNLCTFLHFECRRALSKKAKDKETARLPNNLPAKEENPEILNLRQCMESLEDNDRKLISDYYLNKKPLYKLAEENECEIEDVKVILSNAFQKLQSLVGV